MPVDMSPPRLLRTCSATSYGPRPLNGHALVLQRKDAYWQVHILPPHSVYPKECPFPLTYSVLRHFMDVPTYPVRGQSRAGREGILTGRSSGRSILALSGSDQQTQLSRIWRGLTITAYREGTATRHVAYIICAFLRAMAISLPPIGSWSKLLGDFFAVKGRPEGLQVALHHIERHDLRPRSTHRRNPVVLHLSGRVPVRGTCPGARFRSLWVLWSARRRRAAFRKRTEAPRYGAQERRRACPFCALGARARLPPSARPPRRSGLRTAARS
ncbi:hypothetical protein BKA93DRAFT_442920 [Sparassis latifolia]